VLCRLRQCWGYERQEKRDRYPNEPHQTVSTDSNRHDRRALRIALLTAAEGLSSAKARGHGAVVLLGDAPYYARFGFSGLKTGELSLPGPFERDRLLGLELREGALDGAWGMIAPAGAPVSPTEARRAKVLRSVPHAA